MSERERWIVYPLLLMTLGIVLRDKLAGATNLRAQRVICNQLEFVNDKGTEVAGIDGTKSQPFLGNFAPCLRQLPSSTRTWPLLDPRPPDGQEEPRTK